MPLKCYVYNDSQSRTATSKERRRRLGVDRMSWVFYASAPEFRGDRREPCFFLVYDLDQEIVSKKRWFVWRYCQVVYLDIISSLLGSYSSPLAAKRQKKHL